MLAGTYSLIQTISCSQSINMSTTVHRVQLLVRPAATTGTAKTTRTASVTPGRTELDANIREKTSEVSVGSSINIRRIDKQGLAEHDTIR